MLSEEDLDLSAARVGEHVNGVPFCVMSLEKARARNKDEYLKIELSNSRRQHISGNVWNGDLGKWKGIRPGDAIEVTGILEEGFPKGSAVRIAFTDVKKLDADHPVRDVMNPVYEGDVADLHARLENLKGQIAHPGVRRFVELYFADDAIPLELFSTCPAAMGRHHAYLHGLLEHTLEVADIALNLADLPGVRGHTNRDIVLAGALLHDSGKVFEYSWKGEPIAMSASAGLTNHMATAAQMSARVGLKHEEELKQLGFTDELRLHIEHIILSHHGSAEHGAVVEPRTMAAIIVHQADVASAHIRGNIEAMKGAIPDEWGRVKIAGPRRLDMVLDPATYDPQDEPRRGGGGIGKLADRRTDDATPEPASEEMEEEIRHNMADEAAKLDAGLYTGALSDLLKDCPTIGRKPRKAKAS